MASTLAGAVAVAETLSSVRLVRTVGVAVAVAVALLPTLAACAGSAGEAAPSTGAGDGASSRKAASGGGTIASLVDTAAGPSTTMTPSSATPSSSAAPSSSADTTSTTSTTSVPPPPPGPVPLDLRRERVVLGHSVEGRPIVARRVGNAGGRRVLVIGVIHGDEDAGVRIVEDLAGGPVEPGVEMWLVESMNPDGQAAQIRHNANGVDLNRNFPYDWGAIAAPGDWEYAGPAPASEPETQTMVATIEALRPDITVWYHQDLNLIIPSTGREGEIRARYAELTDLPLGRATGGTYTGVAATWARSVVGPEGGVAFIVELGPRLAPAERRRHADAIRTIARES